MYISGALRNECNSLFLEAKLSRFQVCVSYALFARGSAHHLSHLRTFCHVFLSRSTTLQKLSRLRICQICTDCTFALVRSALDPISRESDSSRLSFEMHLTFLPQACEITYSFQSLSEGGSKIKTYK